MICKSDTNFYVKKKKKSAGNGWEFCLAKYKSGIFPASVPRSLFQCTLSFNGQLCAGRQHERAVKPTSSGISSGLNPAPQRTYRVTLDPFTSPV